MRKLGFVRVSSDEQKNIGKSIEAQKELLRFKGIKDADMFIDEGRSAGVSDGEIEYKFDGNKFGITIDLKKRPEFLKMMTTANPGDSIIYTKNDRISRNIIFMEAFVNWAERNQIKLEPINDSMETITRRIFTVIAHTELDKTTERNETVQEFLFSQGKYPYRTPFGYIREEETSILFIDSSQTEIIREVFKTAILSNETSDNTLYKKVCERYNIALKKYYEILKNKVYMGMTHYKTEWKKTEFVPQIISDIDWHKAQLPARKKSVLSNLRKDN